jgi:hypothetical protein
MDRYSGKPFLKLLDSYLLDAISELPEQQRRMLTAMEPKLRETIHRSGSWQQIVADEMRLGHDFRPWLLACWEEEKSRTPAKDLLAFVHGVADGLVLDA